MAAAQDRAGSIKLGPELGLYRRVDQVHATLEKVGGQSLSLRRKCHRHVDDDLARSESFAQAVRTEHDVAYLLPITPANHNHVA